LILFVACEGFDFDQRACHVQGGGGCARLSRTDSMSVAITDTIDGTVRI